MPVDFRSNRTTAARSPRLKLNPFYRRAVHRSGHVAASLAAAAGFTCLQQFHDVLHADTLPATALNVERLRRLAEAIGFPTDEIFLDEVTA